MNPLTGILNPAIRKTLYSVYGVAVVIVGAIQVGYASTEGGEPSWLGIAIRVLAYLGAALGFTAASNTNVADDRGDHEAPYVGD